MKIAIFGSTGFAREVRDIASCLKAEEIVFVDKDIEGFMDDYLVIKEDKVYDLADMGYKFVIGFEDPLIRKKISHNYRDLPFINLVHPSATFGYRQLEKIESHKGNIICAGVRMANNINLGDFGIFNMNCTIGHDCILRDYVTISYGANVSSNISIEEGVHIGANACLLKGESIDKKRILGEYSFIGAGSIITRDVPSHNKNGIKKYFNNN